MLGKFLITVLSWRITAQIRFIGCKFNAQEYFKTRPWLEKFAELNWVGEGVKLGAKLGPWLDWLGRWIQSFNAIDLTRR